LLAWLGRVFDQAPSLAELAQAWLPTKVKSVGDAFLRDNGGNGKRVEEVMDQKDLRPAGVFFL